MQCLATALRLMNIAVDVHPVVAGSVESVNQRALQLLLSNLKLALDPDTEFAQKNAEIPADATEVCIPPLPRMLFQVDLAQPPS